MAIELGRTAIDAVRQIIGERNESERSVMTPARTKFVAYLTHLGKKHDRDDWVQFAKALPKYWAGEYGWATLQDIAMIKAATAQVNHGAPVNGAGPE